MAVKAIPSPKAKTVELHVLDSSSALQHLGYKTTKEIQGYLDRG